MACFIIITRRIFEVPKYRSLSESSRPLLIAFGWDDTLEDRFRHLEGSDEFNDLNKVQIHYFENSSLSLVVLDDDKLIGQSVICKLNDTTA